MKIELLDSRRLTGPNLFSDRPGAILDVTINGIPADQVIATWSEQAGLLMKELGWSERNTCWRVFNGGANLVINAPIDILYAACELNEVAFNRTVATLAGKPLPDLHQSIIDLSEAVAKERNPRLLSLQSAAGHHHVPFLWDDDQVSVGYGKTAITWPANELPEPESVNWENIKSVPLGIVTGTNGKSTTVRLAAAMLAANGLQAGITSTDYIRVGEEILDLGDFSGPGGARTLLRHPQSEAVVLEVARGGLLRRGIGVEHADAALITNIAADHLGEWGINSVAEMAEAKFIVRRALSTDAPLILNADDSECVNMAKGLDQRIIWFGLDAGHPVLQDHLKNQGEAAYLSGDWLVLTKSGETRNIVQARDIPITFNGAARYNIANALGAMTLCHVLGVPDDALAAGLTAFSGDAEVNPGRGNLFEKDGIRIFLDFAHNEHGVRAISDTVRAFNANRYIVLLGQAGDRSDREIHDLVRAVCGLLPTRLLVCDMPGYERGRESGVVANLISAFAKDEGLPDEAVTILKDTLAAAQQALTEAKPGDCLVLLAFTQRAEVLSLIRKFIAD